MLWVFACVIRLSIFAQCQSNGSPVDKGSNAMKYYVYCG